MSTSQIARVLAAVLVAGLVVFEVQADTSPEVTLQGTNTVLTGIYIPYNETKFLDITTTMEAFLGIPYATPPVGDLRFKQPVKKGDLGGSYSAQQHKALCNQKAINPDPVEMNEDCLYLAVHTSSPRVSGSIILWCIGSCSRLIITRVPGSSLASAFKFAPRQGIFPQLSLSIVDPGVVNGYPAGMYYSFECS